MRVSVEECYTGLNILHHNLAELIEVFQQARFWCEFSILAQTSWELRVIILPSFFCFVLFLLHLSHILLHIQQHLITRYMPFKLFTTLMLSDSLWENVWCSCLAYLAHTEGLILVQTNIFLVLFSSLCIASHQKSPFPLER